MIFCIDLKNLKKSDYKKLLDKYPGLLLDGIESAKNAGFSKIWVSNTNKSNCIIAFSHPKSNNTISVVDFEKFLLTIDPINFSKEEKETIDNFNVNSILDKISTHGIEVLTNEEKDFLDKSV